MSTNHAATLPACAALLLASFCQYSQAAADGTLLVLRNAANSSPRITSIWGGAGGTQIVLKSDGTVWDWGYNLHGQLGNGTTNNADVPAQVLGQGGVGYLNSLSAVMGGESHNIALKSDGTVWSWGWNYFGQLGDGTANWGNVTNSSLSAVKVFGLTSVAFLGGRGYHNIAVKTDGTIWTWGCNWYGQLGNGTTNVLGMNTPVQVIGLTNPVAVTAGGFYSMALMSNGTVWTWGNNTYGQLGDGTTTNRYAPVQVIGLSNVVSISGGWIDALAVKSDGTAWTWGDNNMGELGIGSSISNSSVPVQILNLSNVVAVSGGDLHSLARLANGTIWEWGSDAFGEMGNGTMDANPHTLPQQVPGLSNVVISAARDYHSICVKADGTVWSWGDNRFGGMEDFSGTNALTPRLLTGLVSNSVISSADSFESYANGFNLVGTNSWYSDNPAGAVIVATNYTLPYTGPFPISGPHTQALKINGSATNRFCPAFYTNTWVDVMLQACPSTNLVLPTLTNASFALFVTTNLHLAVWNATNASAAGNGWTELLDTTLVSNQFSRITVKADYTPDANGFFHYSVWVNGLASTNPSSNYAAADSTQPWFGEIDALGSFCLDDLTVGTNKTYCTTLASSTGYGGISPSGPVLASLGATNTFILTPSNWFYLSTLSIDGTNSGAPTTCTFTNVLADHTIAASFAPQLAASNTPAWWLYNANPAWAANFDAAALADHDGTGLPAWQDYIAGLDPQNAASIFSVNTLFTNGQQIVTFPTIPTTPADGTRRYYAIEGTTTLNGEQPWTGVAGWTNIQGIGQTVTYTNPIPGQNQFFRARVWLGL